MCGAPSAPDPLPIPPPIQPPPELILDEEAQKRKKERRAGTALARGRQGLRIDLSIASAPGAGLRINPGN